VRRTLALAGVLAYAAACGGDLPSGEIEGEARPPAAVEAGQARQDAARAAIQQGARGHSGRRILFGDLHVHTTYSIDAFVYSLSFFGGGGGTRPPADACDFARYCSQLDFFSINDHAEALLPERWKRIKESIRECNALAGDPADPDLVAYVGWEWTQVGATPETHYGHKNVIFPGLAEDELPARPITSLAPGIGAKAPPLWPLRLAQGIRAFGLGSWADFLWWLERLASFPDCPEGVDTRELPLDCRENAPTPQVLFEKLDQWGFPALVIPHGLAWGVHAPPGARLDNQLRRAQHDPDRQRLIEIFSGHGNSEEFRRFAEYATDADGKRVCPEPTADYLPCCWQAGEIMRARCGDLPAAECEARVAEARQLALEAGNYPQRVFPDTREEEWLDCDQCRDCFKPALTLRPGESAQYAAALSSFDEVGPDGRPLRFRWGFIGSSDDHQAQPGTGYKQFARPRMTDGRGVASERLDRWTRPWIVGEQQDPQRAQAVPPEGRGIRSLLNLFSAERTSSFMYTGGLVAVHADGRDRQSIWDALERREVYGTSGPRILLWFDLLNGPQGSVPMGGEVELAETPRFEVRAVGSFVQQPGCPDFARGLPAERLEHLCLGECYNPGDARHPIRAIEIVRIRPQATPGEPVASLIEDPWRRFECEPDPSGCRVEFDDPEFSGSGHDAVYYARVLQEETPAINGANLHTRFDSDGRALAVTPCFGGYRGNPDDDCLAPVEERAWSSPIYVDQARRARETD
jgi:hypothetical protein